MYNFLHAASITTPNVARELRHTQQAGIVCNTNVRRTTAATTICRRLVLLACYWLVQRDSFCVCLRLFEAGFSVPHSRTLLFPLPSYEAGLPDSIAMTLFFHLSSYGAGLPYSNSGLACPLPSYRAGCSFSVSSALPFPLPLYVAGLMVLSESISSSIEAKRSLFYLEA